MTYLCTDNLWKCKWSSPLLLEVLGDSHLLSIVVEGDSVSASITQAADHSLWPAVNDDLYTLHESREWNPLLISQPIGIGKEPSGSVLRISRDAKSIEADLDQWPGFVHHPRRNIDIHERPLGAGAVRLE